MPDSTKDAISKLFIKHSMHTNQALISDLVVLVDQAITEAKNSRRAYQKAYQSTEKFKASRKAYQKAYYLKKKIEQFNPTKGTDYTKRKYTKYKTISKRKASVQLGNKNKLSDLKRVKSIVKIGGYYKWDLKFPFRHFVKEELIVATESAVFSYKIGN